MTPRWSSFIVAIPNLTPVNRTIGQQEAKWDAHNLCCIDTRPYNLETHPRVLLDNLWVPEMIRTVLRRSVHELTGSAKDDTHDGGVEEGSNL